MAVAVAIGFLVVRFATDAPASFEAPSSPSVSPSSNPTQPRFDLILATLLNAAPSLALDWLVNEDEFNLDPKGTAPSITFERYALVLLYYHTNGAKWRNQYNFLSAELVCNWNDGGVGFLLDGVGCNSDGLVNYLDLGMQ
jgi:hypothetical protein